MSATLRSKIIRLAHAKPELRPHLLPILKAAADDFEDAVKGKKFTNPETGNKVEFGSLPAEEQKKLREKFKKDEKGGGDKKKPSASKTLSKLKIDSKTKDAISKKMEEEPDSFGDDSPGKSTVKDDGASAKFDPPGVLKSFLAANSGPKEEKMAEEALKEWAANELGMGAEDFDEWYDLDMESSRDGTFSAKIKKEMLKK